jgi:seryl-tRNA synthetase
MTRDEAVALRAYLERIIDERDRQYDMRFRASEVAVTAAFAAQEKSTAAAFLSSEKAIVKAEEAQKAYNAVHNDLSRKMDRQTETFIARSELEDKLKAVTAVIDAKEVRLSALENGMSNIQGRMWAIGVGIMVLSMAVSIALHFIR